MSQSEIASTCAPRLRPGDTVAVVAPSGPVEPARLDAGLAILASRYRIRIDRSGVLTRSGFLAGDDARRADELNRAFRDPDVRAVIMARGGYGLTRILDRLDAEALRADPIPIVGFSDGTALLAWALMRAGVRGIHGPMVGQMGELPPADLEGLFCMLEDDRPAGAVVRGAAALGAPVASARSGPLLGGNLCLWSHLVGCGEYPPMAGAIFLCEDVGERPYAIDRYLTHLGSAGGLGEVNGAIVGDFTSCEEVKLRGSPSALAVVSERLRERGVPGLQVTGIGHGRQNRALPFGGRVSIDPAEGLLYLEDAAVG